jgi:hypothetical protein
MMYREGRSPLPADRYEPPGRHELEEIARAIECLDAAGERYRAESK